MVKKKEKKKERDLKNTTMKECTLSLLEKAHHSAILNDSYKLLNEVLHKQSLQLEMIVKYLHIVTDSEKRKD